MHRATPRDALTRHQHGHDHISCFWSSTWTWATMQTNSCGVHVLCIFKYKQKVHNTYVSIRVIVTNIFGLYDAGRYIRTHTHARTTQRVCVCVCVCLCCALCFVLCALSFELCVLFLAMADCTETRAQTHCCTIPNTSYCRYSLLHK